MENKIILENEIFYCQHIDADEELHELIHQFTVQTETGQGLVDYLQYHALRDEFANEMRTYLVRDKQSHELVGYFSLKAGMVSFNERKGIVKSEFDCVPGIELANFAVNNSYKEKHDYEGLGSIIFSYFILPIAKNASKQIGVKMLYIFALPYANLIHYYETLRFGRLSPAEEYYVHNRIKPRYDADCIFMCQALNE